jgi:hypothetical protein
MIKEDLDALYNAGYNKKQLCYIVLMALDIIEELKFKSENARRR